MHYNQNVERNLAARMRDALSPAEWELLRLIARTAADQGLRLYIVGGFPRDLLLGYPIADFDLVVEGHAEQLAEALVTRYGGKMTGHSKFGTAKWWPGGAALGEGGGDQKHRKSALHVLDFVSARSETYKHPAALPSVAPGTIEDDLKRRDFSINALAIRLDGPAFGELRDEVGGWDDLMNRSIRVLHDRSFLDDPTRMYRAARYESRYDFKIEQRTLALIPPGRALVEKLSPHRVRRELDLALGEGRAGEILSRLEALDLLNSIHPALSADGELRGRFSSYESEPREGLPAWPAHEIRWLLWLMDLPSRKLELIDRRLHFTGVMLKALIAASNLWHGLKTSERHAPSHWVERLESVPLMASYAVAVALPEGPSRQALSQYLATWRHVHPRTTGHDLKRLGVPPGASYQAILRGLRRAWLDGKIGSAAEEYEYLHRLLNRA